MKKRLILLIFLFILVCLISFVAYSNYVKTKETITGEAVTGEITNANLAVSVSVVIGEPSLTITDPKNNTYISSKNLSLNFIHENAQTIWYNLDQVPGTNTTITGNTTFNTTVGQHTLFIYANNTNGNKTSDSVNFNVNISKFKVIYDEFSGNSKGSSTDFNSTSYEKLQNLSDLILEDINYGKIEFNEVINVTDDFNVSNREINLDNYTEISLNHIKIDSIALPNLNKSATLFLYNLSFTNPRILRDGSVCPESICTEVSYSGGTLIFNVTHFTVYSAEETPSGIIYSEGGGGGGIRIRKIFTLDPEEIKVKLEQGQNITETIKITNKGNQPLKFSIINSELEEFLEVIPKEFSLNVGESKTIILDFLAKENVPANLYLGKLILKEDETEKEIFIAIEVVTISSSFDVKATIPMKFTYIRPGGELVSKIELFNLEESKKIGLQMDYIIKDEEGNEIIIEHETGETQTIFSKTFNIPKDTKPGRYILYVRATQEEDVVSSTAWFNIGKPPIYLMILKQIEIILLVLGIIVIIGIIILYKKKRVRKKKKTKENFQDYRKRIIRGIEKHKR